MNDNFNYLILPDALKVALFVTVVTVFWIWQFVKCSLQEHPGSRKILWLVLIALTHWIGATIYYFYKLIQKKYK